MKIRFVFLAGLLVLPVSANFAAEQYQCSRITSGSDDAFRLSSDEYVELTLDEGAVQSRIHVGAASKDLTFSACADVAADGSNFSRWFAKECRNLDSADGASYTIEPYLAGAYAGVSPTIDAGYAMHSRISEIGAQLGTGTPLRTFVIYADRRPVYEFFCYQGPSKP